MQLYKAIYARKSNRKYKNEALPADVLNKVKATVASVERLCPKTAMNVHVVEDGESAQKILRGLVGEYGKVYAPHYLVVTSEVKDGYLENVGFTLENIILELTCMGIATCWIGGGLDKESLARFVNAPEGQQTVIIAAFGYPQEPDSLYRKSPDDAKRLPLSKVLSGSVDETMEKILDAARMSPSAANKQPWRFLAEDDRVHLFIKKGNIVTRRLWGRLSHVDAGIALSHIVIASKHYGKDIRLKKVPLVSKDDHKYLVSILTGH